MRIDDTRDRRAVASAARAAWSTQASSSSPAAARDGGRGGGGASATPVATHVMATMVAAHRGQAGLVAAQRRRQAPLRKGEEGGGVG